ncbi:MAG: hypothetical protein HOO86_13190 [Bacteroidales bacterium]|nr:hypothetical protein [Bacteroidales bacterium]
MRNLFRFGLLIFLTGCAMFSYSQEQCKVLKPEISGTYEGKCKKGLANGKGIAIGTDRYEGKFSNGLPHGKGTYTWSTGETYTGEWFNGKRDGVGVYTMHVNGKDSVQDGIWQKDKFGGPKPKNPVVIYKSGVDRYNFQKNITAKNRVLIDLLQNGSRNIAISNFLITCSSGYETKIGESIGYDEVTFPVTIKLSYSTMNKLHTMPIEVKFEFEISEPGDWTVELNN